MDNDLRNWLLELFPNLHFFEEPITDDSLLGIALVHDEGLNWVTVYDDYKVRSEFGHSYVQSEHEEMDEKFQEEFGNYFGVETPMLIHDPIQECDCFSSRGDVLYYDYIMLEDISSLEEAFNLVQDKNTVLYISLDEIDQLSNYA